MTYDPQFLYTFSNAVKHNREDAMHHHKFVPKSTAAEVALAVRRASGKRYCTGCQLHRPAEQFEFEQSRYCETCASRKRQQGSRSRGGSSADARLYRVDGKGMSFGAIVAACPGVPEPTLRSRLTGPRKCKTLDELRTGKRV